MDHEVVPREELLLAQGRVARKREHLRTAGWATHEAPEYHKGRRGPKRSNMGYFGFMFYDFWVDILYSGTWTLKQSALKRASAHQSSLTVLNRLPLSVPLVLPGSETKGQDDKTLAYDGRVQDSFEPWPTFLVSQKDMDRRHLVGAIVSSRHRVLCLVL